MKYLRRAFAGSSRVDGAYYDKKKKIVHVIFDDGVRWKYIDVPEKVWDDFYGSASPGRFIWQTLETYPNGQD